MTTGTTEPQETAAPTPAADRWFLSDCEGQLVIIREAKLRNVTRDEDGEITSYRLPAEWGPDVVIAEWDLNTWDEGDDESDDLIRQTAARIVADHNEVERLRAELATVRGKKALARAFSEMQGFAQRETARADKAEAERNTARAELNGAYTGAAVLREELDEAREQVKRVRELHAPEEDPRRVRDCKGCRTRVTFVPYEECKTIHALDRTEAS